MDSPLLESVLRPATMDLLDLLMLAHGSFVVFSGGLGLIYPRAYIVAFSKEAESFAFYLVVRLYSSLILGQAGILYALTSYASPATKRWAARAYTFIFSVSAACIFVSIPVEEAQDKTSWVLWVVGASFAGLAAAYGFFGFCAQRLLAAEGDSETSSGETNG